MDLSAAIALAHGLAAFGSGVPGIALATEEAETLSEAINNVLRHYNVGLSDQMTDWIMLLMVAATIYTPRIAMLAAQRKTQKPSQSKKEPETPTMTLHMPPDNYGMESGRIDDGAPRI